MATTARSGSVRSTTSSDGLSDRPSGYTPFRHVLLKIHSRCNLACRYCYVYEHVDQSWRRRPTVMTSAVVDLTAARIAEHARAWDLSTVCVTLHGGEPLLAGPALIEHTITTVRAALPPGVAARFTIQTNGVLLNRTILELFREHHVTVGISLDGDEKSNDRERRFSHGGGSYASVRDGLAALAEERFRHLFSGLLCTVDLRNDPIAVYEGLLHFQPPRIDLLLPHGNWTTAPPGRDPAGSDTPYAEWLIRVFDRWYDAPRRETDVRLFGTIMSLLLGGSSNSEVVGLSPVDFVVIETDGSIEQGDALKTTADGMAATGLHVDRNSLDDALRHPAIRTRQIGLAALGDTCRRCDLVRICGGGHYAHRYRAGDGFANPTVYCLDQQRLIRHIRSRMAADLARRTSPVRSANRMPAPPATVTR